MSTKDMQTTERRRGELYGCKMRVEEKKAAATYQYKGKNYYCCSVGCKNRLIENPEKYVSEKGYE